MQIQSGRAGSGQGDPAWTLLTGSGNREFRQYIAFSAPFAGAPNVTFGIVLLDAISGHNTRINADVRDISASGFTLVLSTWADTLIWACHVNWLAIRE
jgi:hypothetical protein